MLKCFLFLFLLKRQFTLKWKSTFFPRICWDVSYRYNGSRWHVTKQSRWRNNTTCSQRCPRYLTKYILVWLDQSLNQCWKVFIKKSTEMNPPLPLPWSLSSCLCSRVKLTWWKTTGTSTSCLCWLTVTCPWVSNPTPIFFFFFLIWKKSSFFLDFVAQLSDRSWRVRQF